MKQNILLINARDELLRLDIAKIVFFEADGNYTKVTSANKLCSSICMNLSQMEKSLEAQLKENARIFARIGKRYIINLNYIYQIQTLKQRLTLSDQSSFVFHLEVSKDALKKLKEIVATSYTQQK